MPSYPYDKKLPPDSHNRDYDIFEELPDGTTLWRARVFGMANVESKLRELGTNSSNKFFALYLLDKDMQLTRPVNANTKRRLRATG